MIFRRIKFFKKPDKEAEQKLRDDIENEGGLEKSDIPAMVISAMFVFIPVALIVLVGLFLLSWLFFI